MAGAQAASLAAIMVPALWCCIVGNAIRSNFSSDFSSLMTQDVSQNKSGLRAVVVGRHRLESAGESKRPVKKPKGKPSPVREAIQLWTPSTLEQNLDSLQNQYQKNPVNDAALKNAMDLLAVKLIRYGYGRSKITLDEFAEAAPEIGEQLTLVREWEKQLGRQEQPLSRISPSADEAELEEKQKYFRTNSGNADKEVLVSTAVELMALKLMKYGYDSEKTTLDKFAEVAPEIGEQLTVVTKLGGREELVRKLGGGMA